MLHLRTLNLLVLIILLIQLYNEGTSSLVTLSNHIIYLYHMVHLHHLYTLIIRRYSSIHQRFYRVHRGLLPEQVNRWSSYRHIHYVSRIDIMYYYDRPLHALDPRILNYICIRLHCLCNFDLM